MILKPNNIAVLFQLISALKKKRTLAVLATVFNSANIFLKPPCIRYSRDCWKFKEQHGYGPWTNVTGKNFTCHSPV